MSALAETLEAQGVPLKAPSPRLADISFYIEQHGNWTAGELLNAIGAVGGLEVKAELDGYTFESSPVHDEVATQLYDLIQSRRNQREAVDTIAQIFTRDGHTFDLPLDPKEFRHGAPVAIDSFDVATRAKLLEPLDEQSREKVALVWPILTIGVYLRASNGRSMSTDIAPFPPEYQLNPSKDWKAYDVDEALDLHKTIVRF